MKYLKYLCLLIVAVCVIFVGVSISTESARAQFGPGGCVPVCPDDLPGGSSPGGSNTPSINLPTWNDIKQEVANCVSGGCDIHEDIEREINNCFSGGCDPEKIYQEFDWSSEAFGELGRVLYQSAATTMRARHAGSTVNRLTRYQKRFLQPYCSNIADRVEVIYNARLMDYLGSFRGRSLPGESAAQTYGHRIYVGSGFSERNFAQIVLLAHELAHACQYEEHGRSLSNFGYHYFKSWARNAFKYSQIDHEEKAADVERRFCAENCGVFFNNNTDAIIWITIGYKDKTLNEWVAQGWYAVEPAQSRALFSGVPQNRYYYYYAESADAVWTGEYAFWLHPTDSFGPLPDSLSSSQAAASGYIRQEFVEVDIGSSVRYEVGIDHTSSSPRDRGTSDNSDTNAPTSGEMSEQEKQTALNQHIFDSMQNAAITTGYSAQARAFADALLANLDDFPTTGAGITRIAMTNALWRSDAGLRINAIVHRVWEDWLPYGPNTIQTDPALQGLSPLRVLVIRMIQGRQITLSDAEQQALYNLFTRPDAAGNWQDNINGIIGAINRDVFAGAGNSTLPGQPAIVTTDTSQDQTAVPPDNHTQTQNEQPDEPEPQAEESVQADGGSAQTIQVTDFETFGTWQRGDEPWGTFTQSSEQHSSGQSAGKFAYDFPAVDNNYIVFRHSIAIDGHPDALRMNVYGDGSTHFLNIWVEDANKTRWQFTFGRIDHTGWQTMIAPLDLSLGWPNQPINNASATQVAYPITLYALVLDAYTNDRPFQGAVYVDDLEAVTFE